MNRLIIFLILLSSFFIIGCSSTLNSSANTLQVGDNTVFSGTEGEKLSVTLLSSELSWDPSSGGRHRFGVLMEFRNVGDKGLYAPRSGTFEDYGGFEYTMGGLDSIQLYPDQSQNVGMLNWQTIDPEVISKGGKFYYKFGQSTAIWEIPSGMASTEPVVTESLSQVDLTKSCSIVGEWVRVGGADKYVFYDDGTSMVDINGVRHHGTWKQLENSRTYQFSWDFGPAPDASNYFDPYVELSADCNSYTLTNNIGNKVTAIRKNW